MAWSSVLPYYVASQSGGGVWPTAPSRDVVIRSRVGFQGVFINTRQYGTIRAWGPELGSLADDDADSYVRQVLASVNDLGEPFTAVEFAVSWNYRSPQFQYPVPGNDLSQNLQELRRRVKRAIIVGAPHGLEGIYIFCAGDGEGAGPGYNDPVGWTYGRQWLMAEWCQWASTNQSLGGRQLTTLWTRTCSRLKPAEGRMRALNRPPAAPMKGSPAMASL